jgi:Flp pilus assembly protein TadB
MAKKRYTKLEEEIIQILDAKDREPAWRRASLRRFRPRLPRRRPSLPQRPGKANGLIWLGATFGLALLAIMAANWSHLLALILALACILLFLSPIVFSRRSDPIYRPAQQWRGRDVEFPPPRDGITGEIRYRMWQYRNRDRGDR